MPTAALPSEAPTATLPARRSLRRPPITPQPRAGSGHSALPSMLGTRAHSATVSFAPGVKRMAVAPSRLLIIFNDTATTEISTLSLHDALPILGAGGGILTGSDTVTVSGPTNWVDGFMSGTGVTNANGGLTVGGAHGHPPGPSVATTSPYNSPAARWLRPFRATIHARHTRPLRNRELRAWRQTHGRRALAPLDYF